MKTQGKKLIVTVLIAWFGITTGLQADEISQAVDSSEGKAEVANKGKRMKISRDFYIIDLRYSQQYSSSHIPGAVHLVTNTEQTHVLPMDKQTPILLYCDNGKRALSVSEQMQQMGYTQVYILHGGMMEWHENHGPVISLVDIE